MSAPPTVSVLLLVQADGLIADSEQGGRHSLRIACWLTRAALEQRVAELLDAKGWDAGRANMRSRLSCLESAYAADDDVVASQAEYAWAALSRVCHKHAYELAPTVTEARHLGTVVAGLGINGGAT
ncbi:hypothetical protein KV100_03115 [Mumia sp. zg.B21]|uniref:hypothetical protein n=1 Tax=Mumia sp. zg.B21 TaxID=2855447 RepID=UPI001C6E0473|nr:hypothetical protein [Mumia sp. zg.B21]MBW9208631.1 hypothetical protein [Mumia sp. zg.B21]